MTKFFTWLLLGLIFFTGGVLINPEIHLWLCIAFWILFGLWIILPILTTSIAILLFIGCKKDWNWANSIMSFLVDSDDD